MSLNQEHLLINDQEFERVQEFVTSINGVSEITQNKVYLELSDEFPIVEAVRRFSSFERRGHPTLYLADEPQAIIIGLDEALSFSPLVARGGKRSFHGVFFGDLTIGADLIVPVAVKPHKDEAELSCLRDFLSNGVVEQLGFHSLPNVGYIMAGDRAYSMTALDEGLTTLDSIDWADFFPNLVNNPGMQEMWRELSQQTAFLHSLGGMSHGDLAARNVATTSDGGTFLIDWEKARLSLQPPRDVEVRYNHSYSDLSVLLESMCLPPQAEFKAGVGIFYGKTEDWWQGFCDIFFDEYCDIRMQEAAKKNEFNRRDSKVRLEADVKEELQELTKTLRSDMEMYKDICSSL